MSNNFAFSDFHNDFLTAENRVDLLNQYIKTKGLIVVGAFFKGNRTYFDAIETIKWLKAQQEFTNKRIYFAFENFDYKFNQMEKLLNLSPVYVTLTWNNENSLGYGALSTGGLKSEGFEAIKLINKYNIAVDLAHSSKEGYYDIIDKAKFCVNSHSCIYEVNPHKRNSKLEDIKLLVEKGGLFGICLYKEFLTSEKDCTAIHVFKHIDCFVQRFGVNNLCLGTDFLGCKDFPKKIKKYSDLNVLVKIMLKNGYSYSDIEKICSKNLSNYLLNGH